MSDSFNTMESSQRLEKDYLEKKESLMKEKAKLAERAKNLEPISDEELEKEIKKFEQTSNQWIDELEKNKANLREKKMDEFITQLERIVVFVKANRDIILDQDCVCRTGVVEFEDPVNRITHKYPANYDQVLVTYTIKRHSVNMLKSYAGDEV